MCPDIFIHDILKLKIRVLLILSFFVRLSAGISSTLFYSVCCDINHVKQCFLRSTTWYTVFSLISNTRHSISSDIKHETQYFLRHQTRDTSVSTDIKHESQLFHRYQTRAIYCFLRHPNSNNWVEIKGCRRDFFKTSLRNLDIAFGKFRYSF